jgi:hypothetical protein
MMSWRQRRKRPDVATGLACLRRGELDEAKRILSECVTGDASNTAALEGLAEIALQRNEGERYLQLTTRLLAQRGGLPPARRVTLCHRQADLCLAQLGDPQRAIESLARIELDYPGSADATRARRRIEQILSGCVAEEN